MPAKKAKHGFREDIFIKDDMLPPLAREPAHEQLDRSGVERKSDEERGRELDELADHQVERARKERHQT